ncbi:hypothetical protein GCM10023083_35580 [Streptomyces phyllanthi]
MTWEDGGHAYHTLLTVPDYPHAQQALERIDQALGGRAAVVEMVEVADQVQAARLGMTGSPTILIDGADPFPMSGATARGAPARISPVDGVGRKTTHRITPPEQSPDASGLRMASTHGSTAAEPSRTRLTGCTSAHIRAGQTRISRGRPTWHQTYEQRIQSAEQKLTLRHLTRKVSAGQRPTQVRRVGLEPTADGL